MEEYTDELKQHLDKKKKLDKNNVQNSRNNL